MALACHRGLLLDNMVQGQQDGPPLREHLPALHQQMESVYKEQFRGFHSF